jgi:DegV family protein with EDD domain
MVSAVIGTILKIKPLLIFDENGKLVVRDKQKGVAKAVRAMAEYLRDRAEDFESGEIFIGHSDAPEIVEKLKSELSELGATNFTVTCIGPIIGTHTGPDTVAIVCKGK